NKDGQKHPVLARPCKNNPDYSFELIYGARRLFVARLLNTPLLARIEDIDDRSGLIEMDIENRVRRNISPYERGISFRSSLMSGLFGSQEDLSRAIGIFTAYVTRLLKFTELPAAVVAAFPNSREIREARAVRLAAACRDQEGSRRVIRNARSIAAED